MHYKRGSKPSNRPSKVLWTFVAILAVLCLWVLVFRPERVICL